MLYYNEYVILNNYNNNLHFVQISLFLDIYINYSFINFSRGYYFIYIFYIVNIC